MSEAIAMTTKNAAQQQPLVVFIEGKITNVRKQDKTFYTTVICPAADAYSQPSVVEIRSTSRFADPEQIVKVNARLGGFLGRQFQVVDKNTGEQRNARSVVLTLDLVE